MWAHYAESHKGVCLEFTSRNPLFFQALRVTYQRYYPVFDMAEEDAQLELLVLLTKSRAWRYEDEYRLIGLERSCVKPGASAPGLITDNSLVELPDDWLKAVIVGYLAEAATLDVARRVIGEASNPMPRDRPTPCRLRCAVSLWCDIQVACGQSRRLGTGSRPSHKSGLRGLRLRRGCTICPAGLSSRG